MLGVIGLGYVGFTSLLGFKQYTDDVIGYDISAELIDGLSKGDLHIYDASMLGFFKENFSREMVTNSLEDLRSCTDIIIAVPTNRIDSGLDLSIVELVMSQVAELGADIKIWLRSTVDDPGLFQDLSNKFSNQLIFYPEFLREGKCWHDFNNPSLTVVGCEAAVVNSFLLDLLSQHTNDIEFCSPTNAITLKLACNSFHALKVCFANEINHLAWGNDVDASLVMRLFSKDKQLNISDAYLKPGLPFGGPCLPKDTYALSLAHARKNNIFTSLLSVNEQHKQNWALKLESIAAQSIGVVGLEFKPETGDFKNSPVIDILRYVSSKQIVVLKNEQQKSGVLAELHAVETVSEMAEQVDVIVTYESSLVGPNILRWEDL